MSSPRSIRSLVLIASILVAVLAPATSSALCRNCPQMDAIITPAQLYRTVAGSLGVSGDCRIYRMTVTGGRSYRATFCEGGGSAAFDTMLEVKGTSCNVIASNADACAGGKSQVDFSASASGYAYIKVSSQTAAGGSFVMAYRETGVAQVGCTRCPSYDYGVFTPTASWQTHSSTLSAGSCRIYKFALQVGLGYTFSFCQGGGTASFDTNIETFYNTCGAGPSNDDSCAGGLSEVSLYSNSGQYLYVRVSGSNGGSGSYTLAYRSGAESVGSGTCTDGLDNDADTLTDCADSGCSFYYQPFNNSPGWNQYSLGGGVSWAFGRITCNGEDIGSNALQTRSNACTGVREWSKVVSPPVTLLPNATYLVVDFRSNDELGVCLGGGGFDQKDMGISIDGGATWTVLNNCYQLSTVDSVWESLFFDISAFAGQTVNFVFAYDTVDAIGPADFYFAIDNIRACEQ